MSLLAVFFIDKLGSSRYSRDSDFQQEEGKKKMLFPFDLWFFPWLAMHRFQNAMTFCQVNASPLSNSHFDDVEQAFGLK